LSEVLVNPYRFTTSLTPLIDDTSLKCYYRFTESNTPFENHSESDDSLGSDADLVVTDGSGSGITYNQAGSAVSVTLPGLPARWTPTLPNDGTSGAYADASGASSLWNFLHYGDSGSPAWTILFWYRSSGTTNNTTFVTTSGMSNSGGKRGLVFYWELPKSFRLYISEGASDSVIIAELPTDYDDHDGDWHFFCFRYDYSLGSNNLKVTRDNDDLEVFDNGSGTPNSGDAFNPLAFGHKGATPQESFIPDANNTTELSIWNRVLTDAEVTTVYNSGNGAPLYS